MTDQTSVVQHRSPGSSSSDENRAIFRFSHISFPSSSVEANSNLLPECFLTIVSSAFAAPEITSGAPWILKNRESWVGYGFRLVPASLIAFITANALAWRKVDVYTLGLLLSSNSSTHSGPTMSGNGIQKGDPRTNVYAIGCHQHFLDSVNSASNVGELGHCNLVWYGRSQAQCRFGGYLATTLHSERTNIPSVTIPSVPSAPMNNFVVSKPADDFRARLRV